MDLTDAELLSQIEKPKKKNRSEIASAAQKKGKSGERGCANYLTEQTEHNFERIPSSGAMVGGSNRNRIKRLSENQAEAMLGDIFPPRDLKYRFVIECKNYGKFAWKKFREKKQVPALLAGWINEYLFDCISYETIEGKSREHLGLLFVKITRAGEWMVGNTSAIEKVIGKKLVFDDMDVQYFDFDSDYADTLGYGKEFFFCEFKKFVDVNKDSMFI